MKEDLIKERTATILIVEDDKAINALTGKKLKQAGFRIKSVFNGTDAIAEIKNGHFDLLLLDFVLPDMTGQQAVEALM